jgi:hypothetical protein
MYGSSEKIAIVASLKFFDISKNMDSGSNAPPE